MDQVRKVKVRHCTTTLYKSKSSIIVIHRSQTHGKLFACARMCVLNLLRPNTLHNLSSKNSFRQLSSAWPQWIAGTFVQFLKSELAQTKSRIGTVLVFLKIVCLFGYQNVVFCTNIEIPHPKCAEKRELEQFQFFLFGYKKVVCLLNRKQVCTNIEIPTS